MFSEDLLPAWEHPQPGAGLTGQLLPGPLRAEGPPKPLHLSPPPLSYLMMEQGPAGSQGIPVPGDGHLAWRGKHQIVWS